jgi:hypothetical protein
MRPIPLPAVVPVRGVSFHQDAVRSVTVGQLLDVEADPANEYDANACAVMCGGELLGHLPKEFAARLRSTGDRSWVAEVQEVLRGSKATGLRIRLLRTVAELEHPSPAAPEKAVITSSAREVRAKSGRPLGSLLDVLDEQVLVRTPDGRDVLYPQSLVEYATN